MQSSNTMGEAASPAAGTATELRNLVGGSWSAGRGQAVTLYNPADAKAEVARFTYSTQDDVRDAVTAAERAFVEWRSTPIVKRCRILAHCKELLEQHRMEIARLIVIENGKTLGEAEAEVRRGLEVVEFAAGMPSLSKGDYIPDISGRIDGYMLREPLGVVVGACPFNFPAMIPMWMFPVAIACGNTFVLKPSEKCPMTATRLVELFQEGGLPAGVLNVLQGDRETFAAMIAAEPVRAVSFVGSTPAAEAVWKLAGSHHKRVQALGGAKNHNIVMPDADPQGAVNAVVGAAYGCAGERCMATSTVVLVGEAGKLLPGLIDAARSLRMGDGLETETTLGPLISAAHRDRVLEYLELGQREGAKLVLDGREASTDGLPDGHFLGASIFDQVTPEMRIAREEIFGPVLCVMRAADLDEAIALANQSEFGNGASIFTNSGGAAQHFRTNIEVGMIGINAGVPAPMAMFSFGGHKNSIYGDLRAQGPDAIEFYTQKKTVIERWFGTGPTGSIWSK
ncbi:CoA-acylating methylmalonate-semialdehyde dehydrogenase [Phycisphaerales bacterium AB-hyl4]|uniref:methylmalonate-semialdehyde dehydrogenase (CoA acylating) n=1 Tax=Natronomicrosphaera hydrolytica TaxID=3242702 RepID=A0ABV4U627_9BACT